MKKILFILQVHSVVDIITNSSSELFVGKNQSKETMIELIKEVYPNYLNEYDELKSIDDISLDEIENYLYYICNAHVNPTNNKSDYFVPNGFTFDDLYEPEIDWKTKLPKGPAWNGEIQYQLKNFSDKTLELFKKRLDPNKEMFFLYSIDESAIYAEAVGTLKPAICPPI